MDLSFTFWLISLSVIPSTFIHVTANGKIFFIFNLNNIPVFLCVCFCVGREREREKEVRDERKEGREKEGKKKERIFSLSIHSQAFYRSF